MECLTENRLAENCLAEDRLTENCLTRNRLIEALWLETAADLPELCFTSKS
jgi:hypothetical protein